MYTRSRLAILSTAIATALAWGQADTHGSFRIDFPKDSPVAFVGADWGESHPAARGGAMVLDLHTSLSLRNSGQRRIRGVTLMVLATEVTPGGKASVSVPSLDIAPGETFPVRIDLRLLRPIQGGGAVVQVSLDGVLFDDLSFYGPNRLESRRAMTVWELEAQRDRRHFKSVLEQAGMDGLQKEMLASLGRRGDRSQPGVQMVRGGGRATAYEPEHDVKFAFLEFPGAPIEPMSGVAKVAGNEARAATFEIRNRGSRPVRYLEMGWVVQDEQGRQFLAGSVPAEMNLAPGQKTQVLQDTALRFPERMGIKGMTGFVNSVEFSDGRFWIPSRAEMASGPLRDAIPPSQEEQRLIQIYLKKGPKALVEELRKF